MHEDNKIAFLREQIAKLTKELDGELQTTEESYSVLAETASRLHEACLWAGWAAWDNHPLVPDVMLLVTSQGMTVAQALSSQDEAPMKKVVHARYFFADGKFFCEGCQRNAQVGCKDGCPMIPRLEIAHDTTDTTT